MTAPNQLLALAARVEAGCGDPHRISRDRDIIFEAINEFDQFMLDDDYDYRAVLFKIMHRMKDRIALAQQSRPTEHGGNNG